MVANWEMEIILKHLELLRACEVDYHRLKHIKLDIIALSAPCVKCAVVFPVLSHVPLHMIVYVFWMIIILSAS